MKTTHKLIIFFLTLNGFLGYGQKSMDIALQYGLDAKSLGLEFRKDISENYKLRAGIGYYQTFHYSGNYGTFQFINNDYRISRNFQAIGKIKSLRFGIERNLGNSFFSIASDIIISHNSYLERYFTSSWKRNDMGQLVPYRDSSNFYTLKHQTRVNQNILRTGIRLGVSMDVPLFKSFYVNVYYLVNATASFLLNESVENNLFEEFSPSTKAFINIRPTANYGIGLRYRFGKK